jgi:hypothetical protein
MTFYDRLGTEPPASNSVESRLDAIGAALVEMLRRLEDIERKRATLRLPDKGKR